MDKLARKLKKPKKRLPSLCCYTSIPRQAEMITWNQRYAMPMPGVLVESGDAEPAPQIPWSRFRCNVNRAEQSRMAGVS